MHAWYGYQSRDFFLVGLAIARMHGMVAPPHWRATRGGEAHLVGEQSKQGDHMSATLFLAITYIVVVGTHHIVRLIGDALDRTR